MTSTTKFYVLIGKRYLIHPEKWLSSPSHLTVSAHPCSYNEAKDFQTCQRVVEKIKACPDVDKKTKAKLATQSITTNTIQK